MLPTPSTRDHAAVGPAEQEVLRQHEETGEPLPTTVQRLRTLAMLPTPTNSDGTSGPGTAASQQGADDLRTVVGRLSGSSQPGPAESTPGAASPGTPPSTTETPRGKLAVDFVAEMMGFPDNWCDLPE